jgi:hypothetical protein
MEVLFEFRKKDDMLLMDVCQPDIIAHGNPMSGKNASKENAQNELEAIVLPRPDLVKLLEVEEVVEEVC